jgi:hypothetical protein
MNETTLRAMLGAASLGLEIEGCAFKAGDERTLTVYATHQGGELLRFGKVEAIDLDASLLAAGLVVLERENATTVLTLDAIFAVEREPEGKSNEKRRTGFA